MDCIDFIHQLLPVWIALPPFCVPYEWRVGAHVGVCCMGVWVYGCGLGRVNLTSKPERG